ncbi:MAG TPA: PqqD family peptide modification chaperone [Pyrinomonadaceae bacterium]|jgi:hypothetical protein
MTRLLSPRFPIARRAQIVVKQLPHELLIYDLERNRAHCLNDSAAAIWQLCDGHTSIPQIRSVLIERGVQNVTDDLIWIALDQLERRHLLEGKLDLPTTVQRVSRREAVKRIGGVVLTVPLIYSVTAPTLAQSASCLRKNQPCTLDAQCCSNNCHRNGKCK